MKNSFSTPPCAAQLKFQKKDKYCTQKTAKEKKKRGGVKKNTTPNEVPVGKQPRNPSPRLKVEKGMLENHTLSL
jgi:hypothetical protein